MRSQSQSQRCRSIAKRRTCSIASKEEFQAARSSRFLLLRCVLLFLDLICFSCCSTTIHQKPQSETPKQCRTHHTMYTICCIAAPTEWCTKIILLALQSKHPPRAIVLCTWCHKLRIGASFASLGLAAIYWEFLPKRCWSQLQNSNKKLKKKHFI